MEAHTTRPSGCTNPETVLALYAALFRSAHLAFIIADNFFRMAGLIGRRPVDFLETGAAFLGPLPFCFAHHAFFAAAILARAAALM